MSPPVLIETGEVSGAWLEPYVKVEVEFWVKLLLVESLTLQVCDLFFVMIGSVLSLDVGRRSSGDVVFSGALDAKRPD